MPDNDFWIGQEQIPVDLSLLLTYSNDEDYWYAPGEYALRVYTVDTLNTNFARPCFAFGERTSDPEMEDVSGAIENTLHELLDSGATPEDVYRIMGLVKESELSPETKEADSYLPIDRGLTEADAMRLTEHEYNGFQANAIIAAALNPAVGEDVLDALATPKYTAAQIFPWRATTAHPAGTRSRRMHLQGMRPERMTRTSVRTRSDQK